MKKFRFRLERVLEYRETVRKEKQRIFTDANNELYEAERWLASLREAQLQNGVSGTVLPIESFNLAARYSQRLMIEIERQEELIVQLREKVEEARKEFVAASQDEEALITMKKKKLEEYNEYIAQEELKYLDELATQRFGKKFGGSIQSRKRKAL